MNTEEFYTDLLEQIRINNDSYNLPSEQSLYFIYSDFLQSSGQFVDDAIDIEYGISGYNFAAFSRDTERGALNLFLTDLKTSKQPFKLYQKDIEGYFKGLIELVSSVLVPAKHELDESNTAINGCSVARWAADGVDVAVHRHAPTHLGNASQRGSHPCTKRRHRHRWACGIG